MIRDAPFLWSLPQRNRFHEESLEEIFRYPRNRKQMTMSRFRVRGMAVSRFEYLKLRNLVG